MNENMYIIWFFLGSISSSIMNKYGWWGLVGIPFYLFIGFGFERLLKYKPKQRTLNDFGNKDE